MTIPAARRPVFLGLDVQRQDGAAGRAGEPGGARLRHLTRPARAVDGEGDGAAVAQFAPELHERLRATARRRSARRAVAESVDDARDPLAVEILARDDDNAPVAHEQQPGHDAPVPEGIDGLAALA